LTKEETPVILLFEQTRMADSEGSQDQTNEHGAKFAVGPIPEHLTRVLDLFSKATVVGLFAIYVFGFLIVSLHNAHYGFIELSPWKPKILSAGTLFLFFTLFPAVVALRVFAFALSSSSRPRAIWWAIRVTDYLGVCCVFALFAARLCLASTKYARVGDPWVALLLVLISIGLLVGAITVDESENEEKEDQKEYIEHPYRSLTAHWGGALLVLSASNYYEKEIWQLELWLLFIGATVILARFLFLRIERGMQKGRLYYWLALFIPVVSAPIYFANLVYPDMKSSWGGGSPTPVVLYLSADSRVLPNQWLQGDLLDESDSGFYVVGRNERNALFIPRTAVSAAYFSEFPLAPSFLQKPAEQPQGNSGQHP
jgi:hypothetical protein